MLNAAVFKHSRIQFYCGKIATPASQIFGTQEFPKKCSKIFQEKLRRYCSLRGALCKDESILAPKCIAYVFFFLFSFFFGRAFLT